MKKTVLSILIVAVLVATLLTATACSTDSGMFRINEERAGKQVTAVASFGDRVGIVDVNDVYASFQNYYNYMYYYYVQYGGMSAAEFQSYLRNNLDETLKSSNESLGRTALYTLKCIDYLSDYYAQNGGTDKVAAMKAASTKGHTYEWKKMDELNRYFAERNAEMEAILACYEDYSYVNAAIRATNDSIQSLYDDYLTEVKEEASKDTVKGDTTPSGYTDIRIIDKPIRLVYEVSSDTDVSLDKQGLKVVALYPNDTTFDEDIVSEDYVDGETTYKAVVIPNNYLTIKDFAVKEAAESLTVSVTYGDFSKSFDISVVAARPTRKTPAKEEEEEEEDNTAKAARFVFEVKESDYVNADMTEEERADGLQQYKFARTAMARLNKYLEDNYRTYDNYLYGNLTTQIRNAASDLITATVTISEEQLNAEYDRLVAAEYEKYLSTPYGKDTLSDRNTIVHKVYTDDNDQPTYGFYYVAQVLFKFTDELSKKIDDFKNEKTASQEALDEYSRTLAKQIGVWYSNPDYDAEAECEDEDCNCPHCQNYKGERVEYTTLDEWYSCVDGCACVACPSNKYLNDTPVNVMDSIEDIVADLKDAGNDFDLANFLDVINGWSYKANEDDGVFTYITDNKYGYLMTPEGIDSGMVASFEKACDTLAEYDGKDIPDTVKAELEKEGVYILSDKGGEGSYAYCVSTYGIHLVALTYYYPNQADADGNVKLGRDGYVELGLNYVTNAFEYEVVTEGNEYKVVKADGSTYYLAKGTLGASIFDTLYSEAVSTATGSFQKAFYDQYADSNIDYYPKGYAYLIKQLQGDND